MDKDKYYEIIERIDECLYFYEHRNFDNTKYYIDLAIYQHYSIAFSYFIAICKNYPFRKIIAFF